ncbi:MAG: heavy metal translocating P-type ATPase [Peptoniphilus sp.]|nr:heavy metal translocating P-type ATPase [Peptoniphilus sp.]MDD7362822.1 heavy metal translocating P-type ATPase [Bacillota bacterium]MDY6043986.1 heavy metal translocating P-type ATPase [Peptoniphilus sp.]
MRTYELENLGCPSCANKIEQRIQKLPYVENATVDFMNKRVVVEGESPTMRADIQKIASDVERDIVVRETGKEARGDGEREESPLKKEVLTIAVLIAAAFIAGRLLDGPAETIVTGVILVIAGYDIFANAIRGIRVGMVFDENLLMAIASIAAFYIGEHYEALGVLLFYRLGEALQDYALDRATNSVQDLLKRDVETAHLLKDGKVVEVEAKDVSVGDRLVLRAGDTLTADAKVVEGVGHISNQHMTGESTPIAADVGDELLAGAIALDGAFEVVVTKRAEDSAMAKIEKLVDDARLNKSATETWINRFASIYTPIVVVAALIVAIVPPLFFGGVWDAWIYKACAFLIISCPCALVLSVPLTMFASIGRASREGIFVKGATAIETLSESDAIAFDKTGTLTDGKFSVARVDTQGVDEETVLTVAATAEQYSNHPIAQSLLAEAEPAGGAKNYREISGKGIVCEIDGKETAVGNEALLESLGLKSPFESVAMTSVFVVQEKVLLGRISFTDSIKDGVADALKKLHRNLKMYIFSGDKKELVERVGNELEVDETFGGLLPDEKVGALNRALSDNKNVVYVGDGINDAPVLAKSDVGIAMGTGGADMAIESADIVMLGDDIAKLPFLFDLSKRTRHISFLNITLALVVKLLVVILSLLGIGNLWLAVFADVGVSLICVAIAMTILGYKSSK